MSTDDTLEVLHDAAPVGTLRRRAGRLSFAYHDAWRDGDDATPLSLSMPLTARDHRHGSVDAYLWGLLPDNDAVLARWGLQFGVSVSHPLGLLSNVGEDVPGAMRIVAADRAGVAPAGTVTWLDAGEVADLVRTVRRDHTAWLGGRGDGRWSLAGAQPKIALLRHPDSGRWGRPSGLTATTHILKPAIAGFDDHDLNEHLCLRAGSLLGLRVVRTDVEAFDDERAIVVERYDRRRDVDGSWRRVHQEDLCQALGVHPARKYQHDGGPSPAAIIALLRSAVPPRHADGDVAAFVDALVFNWLIAGPDAHAKNYAVLLAGPQVRLAPFYDIASALPYRDTYVPKVKLAMKVGGSYLLSAISARAWARFAVEVRVDPEQLRQRARDLAGAVADAFADAAGDPGVAGLASPLPARLVDAVAERAKACAAVMA